MKVGSGSPTANIDSRVLQVKQATGETVKEDEQAKDAAKVTLSQQASTLKSIQEELAKVPDVRLEKVEQIQAELKAGNYLRPSDQIASKMIVGSLIDSLYQGS